MEYLLHGILIGLGLNVLLGPIFVLITQTAIDKGFKASIFLTSGIWLSDAIMAYVCLMFIQKITPYTSDPKFKFYLGMIGGGALILIGMKMVYKNHTNKTKTTEIKNVSGFYLLTYSFQGFLINSLNPFTVFFWIGVFTTVIFNNNASNSETTFFLFGLFGIIIGFDLLKILLAKRIRKYLNDERMYKLNLYSGVIFIVLGVVLMLRSIV